MNVRLPVTKQITSSLHDPKSLLRLHAETMFDFADGGALTQRRDGSPAPRVFVGQTRQGTECWVRHDLDVALVRDIETLCNMVPPGPSTDGPFHGIEPILARIEADGPASKTWTGPAYHFDPTPRAVPGTVRITEANAKALERYLDKWLVDVDAGLPMTALLLDGDAVSLCCSAAVSHQAHEAGVETHPDFRGRGYAGKVTAAWARLVSCEGSYPLYSTSWENAASQAVAEKLQLVQYGSTFHVT